MHDHQPGEDHNHPFQWVTVEHDCSTTLHADAHPDNPEGTSRVFADLDYMAQTGIAGVAAEVMANPPVPGSREDYFWAGMLDAYTELQDVADRWRANADAQRFLSQVSDITDL